MAIAEENGYFIEVPALRFAGSGSATIDCGATPLTLSESFTLEAWFRPDKLIQGGVSVLAANLVETAAPGGTISIPLCLWLDSGILILSVAGERQLSGSAPVAPSLQTEKSWYHIAVVCDRGTLTSSLYRREARFVETRSLPIRASNGGNLKLQKLVLASIAQPELPTTPFTGAFAELRVWNTARSENDVNDYRLQRLVGNESGLLGYWMLDEAADLSMHDSSTQDNDGVVRLGNWERDSGLEMMIGWFDAITWEAKRVAEAQLDYLKGTKLPKWEAAYAQRLRASQDANREVGEQRAQLQEAQAVYAAAETAAKTERTEKQNQLANRTAEIEAVKAETLKKLDLTRRVMLADFIERLQDEVAASKINIAKEYGNVYGLDTVALEVKMVPGYGGVGLQLPEPGMTTEGGRLSTLTVRLRTRRMDEQRERPLAAVPQLTGSTEVFAQRKLGEAGFRTRVIYEGIESAEWHGRVLRQLYAEKEPEQAPLDSIITLVVGHN